MPELPEVETTLRGLRPYLKDKIVCDAIVRCEKLRWPVLQNLNIILKKQKVCELSRRGKYLLLHLTKGTLIIHLGMSGNLRVLTENTQLKLHDHVDIIFSDKIIPLVNESAKLSY